MAPPSLIQRGTKRVRRKSRRIVRRILGPTAYQHYIRPRQFRGERVPYDAKTFFESWHGALPGALTDATTIWAEARSMPTRYHYNAVEELLIEALVARRQPVVSVLDIGSGAGHWIEFFRDVVGSEHVVGVEISELAAEQLGDKYADDDRVRIVCGDVSSPGFHLGEQFDIIAAVGVMFHVVDDSAWRRAIANLAEHLRPEGLILIGGQFGRVTRDVQFHAADRFATWDEFRGARSDVNLVNKRIRSLHRWRVAARNAGLEVSELKKARRDRSIPTPENNVLTIRWAHGSDI
jgi:SAM-dependent methyltransferase